jgi:uncharacterized protein (DUF1697 family)
MRYLTLLRGINVGGNSIIRMTELKACFEAGRFENVSTFIASGNVLFNGEETEAGKLAVRFERLLSSRFHADLRVVLRSKEQLRAIVEGAPKGFGLRPAKFRYDVFFVREPVTVADVLKALRLKEGVDTATPGRGVVYATRLIAKASQSRLSRVTSSPIYKDITIRNWNTTQKLYALMNA